MSLELLLSLSLDLLNKQNSLSDFGSQLSPWSLFCVFQSYDNLMSVSRETEQDAEEEEKEEPGTSFNPFIPQLLKWTLLSMKLHVSIISIRDVT